MAESKPTHFNGAYYAGPQGVSNPAQHPPQTYHNPGRHHHRSCGLCCLIGTLLKLIFAIVVILGIAALVIWLVLRPSAVNFYVEDGSLTEFNLTNRNTLHYNLNLSVSIRNPNKKIGIDYDELDAAAYYVGERFGWVQLSSFYQGHENTTVVQPAFSGQSLMVSGPFIAGGFDVQKVGGFFYIDVKIHTEMRFKIGHLKTTKYTPKIWCHLMVPLAAKNSSSPAIGGFTRTKCHVRYF